MRELSGFFGVNTKRKEVLRLCRTSVVLGFPLKALTLSPRWEKYLCFTGLPLLFFINYFLARQHRGNFSMRALCFFFCFCFLALQLSVSCTKVLISALKILPPFSSFLATVFTIIRCYTSFFFFNRKFCGKSAFSFSPFLSFAVHLFP